MSINVLFQGIVDIALKVAGYTPFFIAFPWRVDFLFLTGVSVLLGWQTLSSMKQGHVDMTKNSIVMSFLVEIGLVVSDFYFVIRNLNMLPYVSEIRMPFVILTLINVVLLLNIMKDLRIYKFFEYRIDLFMKKIVLPLLLTLGLSIGNVLAYDTHKTQDHHHYHTVYNNIVYSFTNKRKNILS